MGEKKTVDKSRQPVTSKSLIKNFCSAGIKKGDILLVHSSLTALGWVCGGPVAVIEALLHTVGPEGTVVMPAQSSDYSEPKYWSNPPVPEKWYQIIRKEMPAYQVDITPTKGMGIIAETFRTYPGTIRSSHPCFSFAARGKKAKEIVADHHLSYSLGEKSPLARIYQLNGYILLLGVGYDRNTSLHLAEYRANYPKKESLCGSPIMENGRRKWVEYPDLAYNSDDFKQLGQEFDQHDRVIIFTTGFGQSHLIPQKELLDFAVDWFERNRN